ncbi:MAG: AAA family ATPase [Phycisphaerae bacterium]
MDARQVTFRLPGEDEPLSPQQRDEIVAAVKAHMARHGVTQQELSAAISYGAGTVNQVLHGKYPANREPVLRAMAAYVESDALRRSGAKPIGFFPTAVFEAIRSLATFAKSNARSLPQLAGKAAVAERPRIAMGFGPAGCGKTIGGLAYAMEDPLAIYVRFRSGASRLASMARDICDAMSIRGARRSRSVVQQCYDSLRGSQRLLILDEWHRAFLPQCDFVRDLSDVCGIPVLILATQKFFEQVMRVRVASGQLGFDQFTSRIGYTLDLLKGADGKGGTKRPFYSLDEVRTIFRRDGLRITPDGLECLQAIACTTPGGMLRLAMTVFDKAARAAKRRGCEINMALILSSLDASMLPPSHGGGDEDDGGEFGRRVRGTLAQCRSLNARKAAAAAG